MFSDTLEYILAALLAEEAPELFAAARGMGRGCCDGGGGEEGVGWLLLPDS